MTSYINLIKKFWSFVENKSLPHNTIAMYLLLLEEWDNHQNLEFSIADGYIQNKINISRKTIKNIREQLQKLGLIQFQSTNGLPTIYKIVYEYGFSFETIKMSSPNSKESKSTKTIELDITTTEPPLQDLENKEIPTLNEFMEYAKTVENYDQKLDLQLKNKYEMWVSKGWKNGYDRPITNWKLSLKSTMAYMTSPTQFESNFKIPKIKRPTSTYNE